MTLTDAQSTLRHAISYLEGDFDRTLPLNGIELTDAELEMEALQTVDARRILDVLDDIITLEIALHSAIARNDFDSLFWLGQQ